MKVDMVLEALRVLHPDQTSARREKETMTWLEHLKAQNSPSVALLPPMRPHLMKCYLSSKKRKKCYNFQENGLESSVLSETSQSLETKYHLFSLSCRV